MYTIRMRSRLCAMKLDSSKGTCARVRVIMYYSAGVLTQHGVHYTCAPVHAYRQYIVTILFFYFYAVHGGYLFFFFVLFLLPFFFFVLFFSLPVYREKNKGKKKENPFGNCRCPQYSYVVLVVIIIIITLQCKSYTTLYNRLLYYDSTLYHWPASGRAINPRVGKNL